MNYKKIIGIGATVLIAGMLVGCSGGNETENTNEPQEAEVVNQEIVAMVNDEAISKSELEESLEYIKLTYEQQGINLEESEEFENLERQVLDQLVNTKLLMQEIEKSEFEPSTEQVEEQVDEITSQFETEEEMNEILEANNLTVDGLRNQIAEDLKYQNYISENTTVEEATDEELRELYEQYSAGSEDFPDYELLKDQLSQEIMVQREQQQLLELVEKLKQNSEIEILI